ncbi:RagB/SusD family nutrient uptake outer membrane protein [Parapedobacter sp. 10938]|uniref:RagB/SusD family nutrient uptake outer membrane protein n=1 Tax=Parapedobacter flavus TaxID=3110225 RepID=UPI002DBC34E2|nr:RagB/SusD family nutrient uptake outer membrane protein [Parapedobacter sp. 10938]MEC3880094.1 RagB/SusD family nutrient uptake outer membrane protein [Parapedobacter sp. 10938]
MKYHSITLFLAALMFASCGKDFLERFPLSQLSPETFFNNERDLELYTNSFYAYLPGEEAYLDDQQSDNLAVTTASIQEIISGKLAVPTSASEAGWTWGPLRNINYFLANYQKADEPQAVKDQYAGLARFFRAMFYFEKVKRFGDVPWYAHPLDDSSEELYKARDPRSLVMDSVLADVNFAVAHLGTGKSTSRITRWTALALKSRICLFEGTFRKYHTTLGLDDANQWLEQAYQAAQLLMDSGQYAVYSTGSPETDYLNLFSQSNANAKEIILAMAYDGAEHMRYHQANAVFTVATLGNPGMTKSLVNTYLMRDGSRFTDLPGYASMMFASEVENRDPRLKQTIRTPGYTRTGTNVPLVPDFANARTGYQVIKYVTTLNEDGNRNTNDLPIFRYAEVLLNFAEAKAELGTLTQEDVNKSINQLRNRVGMPPMVLSALTLDPVLSEQYTHVDDPLILEIRRERRVELAIEGFRYHDLMRWREGHLLARKFKGMYFPSKGSFDLDGNGTMDVALVDAMPASPQQGVQYVVLGNDLELADTNNGNLVFRPNETKIFNENKHYLFPLPRTERLLNPKLTQNPEWE